MRAWLARLVRIVASIFFCGIVAVCLLLFAMWWEHRTTATLPTPTGSLPVGRTLTAFTNPASREELAVWIWYPAAPSDQPTTDYLPQAWGQAVRSQQGLFMRSFFKRDPAAVRTHSYTDAPMASTQRTYPIVLFRPGGSALTTDFTTLAEDLASHGYVVAGFDAPARSFVFVGSDGRVVGRAPGNSVENANGNLDDPVVGKLLAMWVSDAKAVVDQLQQLNDASTGAFAGRLDLARLGAAGHSFGGAQALQFCHDDARCRAAVDIDGIPFGSVVTESLPKPAMFLLSDHAHEMSNPESQRVSAMIQSIYDRLPQARAHATIRTANHFSFADQILLNSQAAVTLLRFAGLGALDSRRGLAISADYVRSFFDVALNGASPAVLKQLSERYAEVIAERD